MNKKKIVLTVILSLALLAFAGCEAEVVTTTEKTTVKPSIQTITVTSTVTPSAVTLTVIETKTLTTSVTASQSTSTRTTTPTTSTRTTTTSTPTTTTTTTEFTPINSPDGKLQITRVNFTSGSSATLRAWVKNLTEGTLNAMVTVEFLNSAGKVAKVNNIEQVQSLQVSNIAAGAEKSVMFEADRVDASSGAQQDEIVGFNISVVVIP